jgi:WD40 repeat protein
MLRKRPLTDYLVGRPCVDMSGGGSEEDAFAEEVRLLEAAILSVVQSPVRRMIESLIQERNPVSDLLSLEDEEGGDNAELTATEVMSRHKLTLSGHLLGVRCMLSHRDKVFTAGADFKVHEWNSSSHKIMKTLNHGATITCMAIRPDGERLYTGSSNRTLKTWDLGSGSLLHTVTGREPFCLFLVGDALLGGHSKCLKVWANESMEERRTITGT